MNKNFLIYKKIRKIPWWEEEEGGIGLYCGGDVIEINVTL